MYSLIAFQTDRWGKSWLHTPINRQEHPFIIQRLILGFRDPATVYHYALIPANVLTIVGGAFPY